MEQLINELKKLPIQESLELIISNVSDSNNFIMLSSRYNALQNRSMLGTISDEHYLLEHNRINNSLIHFIDRLSSQDLKKISSSINEEELIEVVANVETKLIVPNPSTKKILFCASIPGELAELKVYQEYYNLATKINSQESRFKLVQVKNSTTSDFVQEIIKEMPDYLHFSGHGTQTDQKKKELAEELGTTTEALGGIIMHDNDYKGITVLTTDMLSEMFNVFKDLVPNLKYVILNACFAEEQAIEISKHGLYTIGYTDAVKDNSAIEFTSGFYFGLQQQKSFEDAMRIGMISAISTDINFKKNLKGYYNGENII